LCYITDKASTALGLLLCALMIAPRTDRELVIFFVIVWFSFTRLCVVGWEQII